MRKWNWNYLALAAAIAVIAAAFGVYHHYGAETRIAFVNYPEYILAPLLDQEINPAIRVDALKWTEKSGEELKNYDFILHSDELLTASRKEIAFHLAQMNSDIPPQLTWHE